MKRLLTGMVVAGLLTVAVSGWAGSPMTPARPVPQSSDTVQPIEPPPAAPSSAPSGAPMAGRPAAPAAADGHVTAVSSRSARRAARSAAAVKPGLWEFTSELQMTPTAPPRAGGRKPPSPLQPAGGGARTTYTSCVAADSAVPVEVGPQCKLERSERKGARIAWSMACADTGVRAEGTAEYDGDAMDATMISRLPGAGGKITEMRQHITGRFLGPCVQAAGLPAGDAALPAATGAAAAAAVPRAASLPREPVSPKTQPAERRPGVGSPSAAAENAAPAQDEPEARPAKKKRYSKRRHRHHRARRGSSGTWTGSASRPFGPPPYSNSGP